MTQNQPDPPSASIHPISPPMHLVGEERMPELWEIATNRDAPSPPSNQFHGKLQFREMDEEIEHRAAWKAGMLGAINVLATVLAARWTAMMSVGGAIWLSLAVLPQPDTYKLGLLGIYCIFVVGPCIWLAAKRD